VLLDLISSGARGAEIGPQPREELERKGKMPLDTYRALVKCLHPDSRGAASAAELDEAFGKLATFKKLQKE
jgi:hypothetical protein